MAQDIYVLGINAWDHDVSVCLLKNGEIMLAMEKERLTRQKHAPGFFDRLVDDCVAAAGIHLDDVELIVRNSYLLPVPELERMLRVRHHPYHVSRDERERAPNSPLFLQEDNKRFVTCSHHLAHAYSAFAASPFDRGVVMVVDGVGGYRRDALEEIPEGDDAHPFARESESYYVFEGAQIKTVRKVWMGPSGGLVNDDFTTAPGLGAVYSRVSEYIFADWNKCGEVMGLAPYGRPGMEPLMSLRNGEFCAHAWPEQCHHPWTGDSDQQWSASEHRKEYEDLAWRVQEDTEQVLLERARWLQKLTGETNVCLAGGVALNCVANGKLVAQGPFENVWVQPAAGDNGIAIGCALYGHLAVQGKPRKFVMRSPYLGRTYDRFDEAEAFRPWSVRVTTRRRKHESAAELVADAATMLAAGKVLGWYQGAAEFGPRALGNRSILADPRDPAVKDLVNRRVKFRQPFRPFAPAILAERADEYFAGVPESPYMLLAWEVRPEMRDRVPGITHVDGTARVQTVRADDNPRFHALLSAFAERTGVPILLNTSFNVRGEPIVEVPFDAMDCFLATGIDTLVLHDWVIDKRWIYRPLSSLVRAASSARRALRAERIAERFAPRQMRGED